MDTGVPFVEASTGIPALKGGEDVKINFEVGIVNYNTLTERINHICYKLEYYTFLSAEDRANLLKELNKLIDERNKLAETSSKNEKHRK